MSNIGRIHLTHVIEDDITSGNSGWYCECSDMIWRERHIPYLLFFLKICNLQKCQGPKRQGNMRNSQIGDPESITIKWNLGSWMDSGTG